MTDTDTADDLDPGSSDTPPPADDNATDSDQGDPVADDAAGDEAAKWKAMARKHEKQAKANAAELEKLRKERLTDDERKIEDARAEGAAEATGRLTAKIVAAELKAAGVPAEDVEDLDLAKFIGEDGEIDTDKVTKTGARFSQRPKLPNGSADGGPRGGDKPTRATSLDEAVAKQLSGN